MEEEKRCCWGYGSSRYLLMTSKFMRRKGALQHTAEGTALQPEESELHIWGLRFRFFERFSAVEGMVL